VRFPAQDRAGADSLSSLLSRAHQVDEMPLVSPHFHVPHSGSPRHIVTGSLLFNVLNHVRESGADSLSSLLSRAHQVDEMPPYARGRRDGRTVHHTRGFCVELVRVEGERPAGARLGMLAVSARRAYQSHFPLAGRSPGSRGQSPFPPFPFPVHLTPRLRAGSAAHLCVSVWSWCV
jgi:hypothetical protein